MTRTYSTVPATSRCLGPLLEMWAHSSDAHRMPMRDFLAVLTAGSPLKRIQAETAIEQRLARSGSKAQANLTRLIEYMRRIA